ncbi:hypothetical protein [Streptosporangium sp. NPDC023615]|uniref:hypothetical protein n=1 Tax=Streptosporangium sp. NPDC023615 TaxID=3154794 RepID=UPI003416DD1E
MVDVQEVSSPPPGPRPGGRRRRVAGEVWWLYGTRDGTEHPFAAESDGLRALLPNAHEHVCYSRPAPGDRQGADYGTAGRLSVELLGRLGVPHGADAYLSAPPPSCATCRPPSWPPNSPPRASTRRSSARGRR